MAGLLSWKKQLARELDENITSALTSESGEGYDTDHPTCPECGSTMNFIGHDDDGDFAQGDAYWICNNCGLKVFEGEVYKYQKY